MQQFFTDFLATITNTTLGNWHGILRFVVFLILGFVAIKLVSRFFKSAINKSKLKGATGDFLSSLVKIALLILYVIILLSMLGVDTTSLVAIFSVLTLAISLAVQGVISNFASGIMLVITKPFEEGDYVDIGGDTGTVESINITCTKIRTGDNKLVTIPNGNITNATVINYTTKGTRRVDLTVSVAYGTDVSRVKEILIDLAASHELILSDQAPMVRLAEHGASSIDFAFRVWCASGDYWTVYFDLKEQIYTAFAEKGIEIPFPQMDVHVVK